jgi:hypothetical protein
MTPTLSDDSQRATEATARRGRWPVRGPARALAPTLWPQLAGVRSVAVALILAGGAAHAEPYPSDWPPVTAGFFAGLKNGGCPNLAGSYALDPSKPPPFIAKPDPMADRWPFEALTITGDVGQSLTLRFSRSATTMLRWQASLSPAERARIDLLNSVEHRRRPDFIRLPDSTYREYIAQWVLQPESQPHFLVFDAQYLCSKGWLHHGFGSRVPAHLRRGLPDYTRDRSGALIRRDNHLTGFGVPAPFVGQVPVVTGSIAHWSRFPATTAAATRAPDEPWANDPVAKASSQSRTWNAVQTPLPPAARPATAAGPAGTAAPGVVAGPD